MKKKLQLFAASALMMLGLAGAMLQPAYADCQPGQGGVAGGVGCAGEGTTQPKSLFGTGGIFTQVINFLLFFVGVVSVIMIIYGGIQYTTSAGDSGKVTSAKNTILYAIVGLIVSILAYAIVNFVTTTFLTQQ